MSSNARLIFHAKGTPWSREWRDEALLIFDRSLLKRPSMGSWIRKFPHRYGVAAGESLKEIRSFPGHIEKILKISKEIPNRRMKIVILGGGSVGDFAGFVASVYKRGVPVIQVPSTWLAAIDSAHGGKNGLNVSGTKNQIGTIHPPQEVHLVKSFLDAQPEARAIEAAGEILKVALLKGGALMRMPWDISHSSDSLWKALPTAIAGKMSIVRKDPFEQTGVRHLLNLGHTMGHVFEAEMGLPHGLAVAYGLVFATAFSRHAGECSEAAYGRMISHPLWGLFIPSPLYRECLSISVKKIESLLLQDKKRSGKGRLRFIFLKAPGKPVIREIPVREIIAEVERQKKLLRSWHG